jgi:hypothetical protein
MPTPNLDFVFSKDTVPNVMLTNFSAPEDGFVWSTTSWCEIAFDIAPGSALLSGGAELLFDLDTFRAGADLEGQDIQLYVNGLRLATRYVTGRSTILVELAPGWLREQGNVVTIDTPDAARPIDHGQSDTRRLGIQLFSLQVHAL